MTNKHEVSMPSNETIVSCDKQRNVTLDQHKIGSRGPVVNKAIPEVSVDPDVSPDGGWGWLVALGSFMAHVLAGGFDRSGGVFYLRLLDRFGGSSAATAWAFALFSSFRVLFGPLASAMTNRYGCRTVVFCGAVLAVVGVLVSGYATNLIFFYLTYGVLTGFGTSLIFTPGLILVGHFFIVRRGMAVGLATVGAGVGSFIFPPFVQLLFETYGFRGTYLIMAAVMSHALIVGSLYRPLGLHRRIMAYDRIKRKRHDVDEYALKSHSVTKHEPGQMSSELSLGNSKKTEEHIERNTTTSDQFYANTGEAQTQSTASERENGQSDDCNQPLVQDTNNGQLSLSKADGMQLLSCDEIKRNDLSISVNITEGAIQEVSVLDDKDCSLKNPLLTEPVIQIQTSPLASQTKQKFCSEEQTHDIETEQSDLDSQNKTLLRHKPPVKRQHAFSLYLLRDVVFVCFCLQSFMFLISFNITVMFVPALVSTCGLSELQGSSLISVMGISDAVSRIVMSVVLDLPMIKPYRMHAFNSIPFIAVVVSILYVTMTQFWQFALLCGLYGSLTGVYISQYSVIIIEIVGMDKLHNAIGIVLCVSGISALVAPTLGGLLKDVLGSYTPAFYLGSAGLLISGSVMAFGNFRFHRRNKGVNK